MYVQKVILEVNFWPKFLLLQFTYTFDHFWDKQEFFIQAVSHLRKDA